MSVTWVSKNIAITGIIFGMCSLYLLIFQIYGTKLIFLFQTTTEKSRKNEIDKPLAVYQSGILFHQKNALLTLSIISTD